MPLDTHIRLRYVVEVDLDGQTYREEHADDPGRVIADEIRSNLESLRFVLERVMVAPTPRCEP